MWPCNRIFTNGILAEVICNTETSLAVKILLCPILSFFPQSSDKQRRLRGCKRNWNQEIGVWVPKLPCNTSYQISSFHEWEIPSYCFKSIVWHLGLCATSVSLTWLMHPMKTDFSSLTKDKSVHPGCSLVCTAGIIFYFPLFMWPLTNYFQLVHYTTPSFLLLGISTLSLKGSIVVNNIFKMSLISLILKLKVERKCLGMEVVKGIVGIKIFYKSMPERKSKTLLIFRWDINDKLLFLLNYGPEAMTQINTYETQFGCLFYFGQRKKQPYISSLRTIRIPRIIPRGKSPTLWKRERCKQGTLVLRKTMVFQSPPFTQFSSDNACLSLIGGGRWEETKIDSIRHKAFITTKKCQ